MCIMQLVFGGARPRQRYGIVPAPKWYFIISFYFDFVLRK